MPIAIADRVGLAYVAETSFGVPPGGPPTLKNIRFTGESLAMVQTFVRSRDIRPDRQVSNVVRSNFQVEGSISCELSYGTYDDLLLAAIGAASFSSPTTIGPVTTIAALASGNTFSGPSNVFSAINVGQWIRVTGYTNAANNGFFKVMSKPNATDITVRPVYGVGGALVNESAGPSVTVVQGGQAVNGLTEKTFAFERKYTELNQHVQYLGCGINTLGIRVPADNVVTLEFGILGQKETKQAADATIGTGTNTAAPTGRMFASFQKWSGIIRDTIKAQCVGIDFNINNNLRNRLQIGNPGPISQGSGKFNVSGSVRNYYDANEALTMELATESIPADLFMILEDGRGSTVPLIGAAYVFDMGNVLLQNGRRVAGGENTDIIAEYDFEAFLDDAVVNTLRVAKFDAMP